MTDSGSPFRETFHADEGLQRRLGTLSRLTIILVALSIIVSGFSLFVTLRVTSSPFGEFPVQTVHNRIEGLDGPATRVGQAIVVTGTKCYSRSTRVIIAYSWRLVAPVVDVIGVTEGAGTRIGGCLEQTFHHEWPQEAIDITNQLLDEGHQVIWSIVGVETSPSGASQSWETQQFVVIQGKE